MIFSVVEFGLLSYDALPCSNGGAVRRFRIQIARSTEGEDASGEGISKPVSVEAENIRPAVSDTLIAGDV